MKKLWFRAKYYGWGWYPTSIEGWVVTLGFALVFVASATLFSNFITINAASVSVRYATLGFLAWISLLTFLLIYICYKTGERPSWRWGKETKTEKS